MQTLKLDIVYRIAGYLPIKTRVQYARVHQRHHTNRKRIIQIVNFRCKMQCECKQYLKETTFEDVNLCSRCVYLKIKRCPNGDYETMESKYTMCPHCAIYLSNNRVIEKAFDIPLAVPTNVGWDWLIRSRFEPSYISLIDWQQINVNANELNYIWDPIVDRLLITHAGKRYLCDASVTISKLRFLFHI